VNYNQRHANTVPFAEKPKPYPALGGILMWENICFASYEALQAEVSRRFARGLFFQGSYIISKNVGNAGAVWGGQGSGGLLFAPEALPNTITDRFNTRLDRGNLAGTRRNRFLFTGIYELPWGKGRRFASGLPPFANALLGGWDLSTITLLESGSFQTAWTRFDQSNTTGSGRKLTRPDRIGDGNLPHPTPDRWYDISAFEPAPKAAGRFGNSGVGILRGPGIVTVAAGLFKSFSIAEGLRMRIEATFTNIANHPNFYPPSTFVDDPSSFGKMTSVQDQENSGNRAGQIAARFDW